MSDGEVHEAMATGHLPWFFTKRPMPENATTRGTAPQGGIVAGVTDLAHYLAVQMNGRDDVLSADGKRAMMRPAGAASPFYGFGWFVDTEAGTVWHTGTSPGFEATATMLPAQGKAVVVLVNGGSGVGFGETAPLRDAITARALGLDDASSGSRLPQKALFLGLLLLPALYLLATVWAWHRRATIRAKSGWFGLFSLWFPLLTTGVAAWVVLSLAPTLIGSPLGTISRFQPDLGVALTATAVTGVLWALGRLVVAYTGDGRPRLRASTPAGPASPPGPGGV
ncbi:serine hydrolase [Phycicoccus avicenniae]|uniref:serine hydrolase n=1 Tax=Phycicoccus avicenniae TaxID=2828860 RepID=UPI0020132E8A|nr:serine hydrolase [Phycicoccus avicenniae]